MKLVAHVTDYWSKKSGRPRKVYSHLPKRLLEASDEAYIWLIKGAVLDLYYQCHNRYGFFHHINKITLEK